MRAVRWTIASSLGALLLMPTAALANGGAYIELDGTHFLPGDTAVAEAYVSIPKAKQDLLDGGPFYAYVLTAGVEVEEGRPIPPGAIRVGTFSVEHEKGKTYELHAAFTVPELAGAFYAIALCNDPCTISGFAEPLSGSISIVATAREGELLTQRSRLQARMFGLRRDLRKAERTSEELEGRLEVAEEEALGIESDRVELQRQLDRAERAGSSPRDARPLIDGWGSGIILAGIATVGALLSLRRRRRGPTMPNAA